MKKKLVIAVSVIALVLAAVFVIDINNCLKKLKPYPMSFAMAEYTGSDFKYTYFNYASDTEGLLGEVKTIGENDALKVHAFVTRLNPKAMRIGAKNDYFSFDYHLVFNNFDDKTPKISLMVDTDKRVAVYIRDSRFLGLYYYYNLGDDFDDLLTMLNGI